MADEYRYGDGKVYKWNYNNGQNASLTQMNTPPTDKPILPRAPVAKVVPALRLMRKKTADVQVGSVRG